jgi:hypothetical protein
MIPDITRTKILRNLRHSIAERLSHPKVIHDEKDLDDISFKVANSLEKSCFLASRGEIYVYKALIAEFFTHISPYFYCARHSVIFRDMLLRGSFVGVSGGIEESERQTKGQMSSGSSSMSSGRSNEGREKQKKGQTSGGIVKALENTLSPTDPARLDKSVLWPEIYDNKYLNQDERRKIIEMRQFELGVAALFVNKMLDTDQIIMKMDEVAMSHALFSIGESNDCWRTDVNEVNTECDETEGVCGLRNLRVDVNYETFMLSFAKNDMEGDVPDPRNSKVALSEEFVTRFRRLWSKEVKMMRVYLDIMSALI